MAGSTARFSISASDSRSRLIPPASHVSKILYLFVQSPLSLRTHTENKSYGKKENIYMLASLQPLKKFDFLCYTVYVQYMHAGQYTNSGTLKIIWGYSTGVRSQNLAANFGHPPQVRSWRCFSPGLQSRSDYTSLVQNLRHLIFFASAAGARPSAWTQMDPGMSGRGVRS